jgi:UDP-glucose 4-epimerase
VSRELAWVIGRGLLGSHLELVLRRAGVSVWSAPPFAWLDAQRLSAQFSEAIARFGEAAARHDEWSVLWSAGAGVVGTTSEALEVERLGLQRFLELFDRPPPGSGALFFASSAGGVYAGCSDGTISEQSPCQPLSAYGHNKLRQEQMLSTFASERRLPHLIGRIANVYGPNQNMSKPQGFISQLIRSVIQGLPFHVYVPIDTIRDFIYVEDCAQTIVDALALIRRRQPAAHIKILASEESTPLSRVIHAAATVARRNPRIVSAHDSRRALQPPVLRFRSTALIDVPARASTPLPVGVLRVYLYQLGLHCQGRLPPA